MLSFPPHPRPSHTLACAVGDDVAVVVPFAAGDAVNGGAEVVNAVAEAKIAAKGIHDYLFLGE